MKKRTSLILFLAILAGCIFLNSCGDDKAKPTSENKIVKIKESPHEHLTDDLQKLLEYAQRNEGKINDSTILARPDLTKEYYDSNSYVSLWSEKENWRPQADSLYRFIENSMRYGLFPADYHYPTLSFIHRVLQEDSIARKNTALWTRADILLTDAFFSLVRDLKQGRLHPDSVTLRTDTVLSAGFCRSALTDVLHGSNMDTLFHDLEPRIPGYDSLKAGIESFLVNAKFKPFTYLNYPYKDSVAFFKQLEKRFYEIGMLSTDSVRKDSSQFKQLVAKYQKAKGLKITNRVNEEVVNALNNTDLEKFKRIAVTLDRYKLLPDTLPQTYIWVNLPSFQLHVYNADTVVFDSRVIVGAPKTRTPLLTSDISNFVTYPQWNVPASIIFKEMLPKIQENIDYLRKENLMVVDNNDVILDPKTINWKKLSKRHFPYSLKQRQGDDNSLGVIKFNFRNKYSVYLHDTNARWLFGNKFRALSHGCVRMKEWQKMSDFLTRNDTIRYKPDTLRAWIKRQEKHVVSGFQRVPIFIRYFGCEGKDCAVRFYDDIYGEDKFLREKYFANKTIN